MDSSRATISAMHKVVAVLLFLLLIVPFSAFASDPSSANYQILTPVLSSGGYATSTDFSLLGILSPFIANGAQSSASFGVNSGFLTYPFVSTPVVSVTPGNASATLSWTTANGFLGWNPSGYSIGQAITAGGPYLFTNVGNVLTATQSSLTNGIAYHFVVRVLDAFNNVIATSSEVSAIPAVTGTPSGGGGSNGFSSTVTPATTGATVNFTGRAYPLSTVTFLKDAQVFASTVADSNANFQLSLSGLSSGSYVFSLYARDPEGNRSALLSFPVSVTSGVTTSIGGIFIPPTIGVDKNEVKQGDNLVIFGQSSPKSAITISVHSPNPFFFQVQSDKNGAYLYNLDTSFLDIGEHIAASKAAFDTEISGFGSAIKFTVGNQNVAWAKNTKLIGDLNHDGRVNLIDFSILTYWYKRPLTGAGLEADLNGDGKIDLADFSIMAANWTG